MGMIPIDPKLQKSEAVAEFFTSLIQTQRNVVPKLSIPKILLGKLRPGLDPIALSSSIISRFKEAGIPTGPLGEGTPNAMEELVKIICEEVIDAIQNEMRIDVAVDSGMTILSTGASASGPITSTGANPMPHTAVGIPR